MGARGVRITMRSGTDLSARWVGVAQPDVVLDPASIRDLNLFLTRVVPKNNNSMSRPIVVWHGDERFIIDLRARSENGAWRLELGERRPDHAGPDRPEIPDPRLDDLATPVWVTDADRLARWFNAAWCAFVDAPLFDELGWGWMRHAHPDDLVGLLESYEAAQAECRGFDHVLRIADHCEQYVWAHVRGVPRVIDKEFVGFIGICAIGEPADQARPEPSGVPSLLPVETPDTPLHLVRRLQELETTLQLARPAEALESILLRRIVSSWLAEHPALVGRHDEIVLALGEGIANSIVHSYDDLPGDVEVTCLVRDSYAEFRIRDWGSWKPIPPAHDGHGLEIMRALSDDFVLRHLLEGTDVVLRYRLA
jgi:anti-sigma regulatory factor (Ser/Thr protein kinase)